jgi:hypothetical protein
MEQENKKVFQVDGLGPIQVKRVKEALASLSWEGKGFIELRNRLENGEVKESRARMTEVFGAVQPAAAQERDRLFSLYAKITPDNYAAFLEEAEKSKAAIIATTPIRDERKTREELEANAAEFAKIQAVQAEKRAAFEAAAVTIPKGKLAVCLSVCFDDSDMMTDYYHPHALIEEHVLAIVRDQAETERLARSIVAKVPELAAVNFKWKTEKYSMGHGNYLEAKGSHGEVEHKGYNGRDKVAVHYEITFSGGGQILPHPKWYQGDLTEIKANPGNGNGGSPVSEKTVRENKEKNGVEILFPAKPVQEVLDKLKANGWRWSRFAGLWYNRYTPENLEFAKGL